MASLKDPRKDRQKNRQNESKNEMSTASPLAREFMQRLREAERTRDVRELSSLFTSSVQLENLTRPSLHSTPHPHSHVTHQSPARAPSPEAFWRQYLCAFSHVESHFVQVMETSSGAAILEWHSEGQLSAGTPIRYNGVSILEFEGEKIQAFRTYYDSAALIPHASHTDRRFSEAVGQPEINTEASS